jgi:ABC-2 type transport system permease protein
MAVDTTARPPDPAPAPAPADRIGADVEGTRLPVARWVLREQRRALTLWAVSLAAITAMYLAFYPSMATDEMTAVMEGLPEALMTGMGWDRIATGSGYLESTIYGLLAPALLLVYGIAAGARLLAGHEEDGSLELEGTAPISRRQLLLERYAALAFALLVLCAALAVATLVLVPVLGMEVTSANILAATLGLWLFVQAMATVSFAVGAATGRRTLALGVGAGLAVAAYMADTIGEMMQGGDWLSTISPFGWYLGNDPLTQGVDVVGYGLLAVAVVVALVAGLLRYERRDLGV